MFLQKYNEFGDLPLPLQGLSRGPEQTYSEQLSPLYPGLHKQMDLPPFLTH